jgi:hypothetical protein
MVSASSQLAFWPTDAVPRRIVFHSDFDGICAAAVLLRHFQREVQLEPVEYSIKLAWLRRRMHDAAIVDFLFHPEALWWFDHHVTSFMTPALRHQYFPGPRHRWDTRYPSCPSLIVDVLAESKDVSDLRLGLLPWIEWSDIIDSARYESPQQAVCGEDPCILINQALAESPDPSLRVDLVKRIATGWDPKGVSTAPEIKPLWSAFRSAQEASLQTMRRSLNVEGRVGFCNLVESGTPFIRYGVYYFAPDVDYSVIAYDSERGRRPYKIAISANPWHPNGNRVHIGVLARRFGGGGRIEVGSVATATKSACLETAIRVVRELQGQSSEKGDAR